MPRRLCLLFLLFFLCQQVSLGLAQDSSSGPRPGKYRIMSYGATGSPPIFLGYFVLAVGTYKAYLPGDKLSGEGRYSYNAKTFLIIEQSTDT